MWFKENHMEEPFMSKPVRGTGGGGNQPLIPFTPVPLRHRNDGWTVEKQYAFIEAPPNFSRAHAYGIAAFAAFRPDFSRARVEERT
jgi:hypothetical protein